MKILLYHFPFQLLLSILKSLAMSLGEVNYADMFPPEYMNDSFVKMLGAEKQVSNVRFSSFTFFLFILFMPIVLMNLLVRNCILR